MLSILVTSTKGGCGKTTIATNLASAYTNRGHKTLLCECDSQKSSLGWVKQRPKTVPPIAVANWIKGQSKLDKNVDRVIIDAPAALRHKAIEELVKQADIVIVPVMASFFDEEATRNFLSWVEEIKSIRKNKRLLGIVGNRMRLRTKAAARLDIFLQDQGQRAVARLRDSQFYTTAAIEGRGIFDYKTMRARDIIADWQPLLDFTEGKSSAAKNADPKKQSEKRKPIPLETL